MISPIAISPHNKRGGINWSSYCTPRTVTVTAVADTTTTLSWDACTGATSYKVYYGTDGITFGSTTTSSTNSKTVTGLTSGTRYYFYVTAFKDAEENLPSNTVDNGVVYVNNFADLTGLTLVETAGTVTVEDPMGTVVLPQKALTLTNTSAGNCYASIDLGQTYDKLYVQFYVACIKQSTASSYKDTVQIGANVASSECAEVKMNQASGTGTYRIYGLPNYPVLAMGQYSPMCAVNKVQLVIDRVAKTYIMYVNGTAASEKATADRDMRYITIGGNQVSGYVLQVSAMTVNEDMFMDGVSSTYDVGEYSTFFIDSSTDIGIDASAFTGRQITPYDPDGGTSYVDGPLRYMSDASMNYLKYGDTVLFKRGLSYKQKALNNEHSIYLPEAAEGSSLTVSAYGAGDLPILCGSVVYDTWDEYDAVNHIYRKEITGVQYTSGVWIDDTLGLCLALDGLTTMATESGRWYQDGTYLYIRLWDDGDPASHVIDVQSNQTSGGVSYSHWSYLHYRMHGHTVSPNAIVEYCEFTHGGGISIGDNGIARYNELHDIWGGEKYIRRGGSGTEIAFSIGGDNVLVYANKISDCFTGILIPYSRKNALIAFNEIKNIIVNHIDHSGGVDVSMTQDESIKIINNTIFFSPRHADNIPYYLPEVQLGHAVSMQSGFGTSKHEILNNLILLHYNHNNLAGAGSGNGLHLVGSGCDGIVDYNKLYKSAFCDSNCIYFDSISGSDADDPDVYNALLKAAGWIGKDNENPQSNGGILTTLPVDQADATLVSGLWLTTDGTPVNTGDGYVYDFSEWGITEDLSGNPLGATRNIGAY